VSVGHVVVHDVFIFFLSWRILNVVLIGCVSFRIGFAGTCIVIILTAIGAFGEPVLGCRLTFRACFRVGPLETAVSANSLSPTSFRGLFCTD
jgi:hypothetical protein